MAQIIEMKSRKVSHFLMHKKIRIVVHKEETKEKTETNWAENSNRRILKGGVILYKN